MFLHSLSLTHTHPFPLLLKTHRTPTHPFLSLCSMLSGEGKVYPLQYSGLENSVDCIVRGLANSWTRLSDFRSLTHSILSCKKKNKKTFPILPAPCLCLIDFSSCYNLPKKNQFKLCHLLRTCGLFSLLKLLSMVFEVSHHLAPRSFSNLFPTLSPLFQPHSTLFIRLEFHYFLLLILQALLKCHFLLRISLVGPVGFNLFFPCFLT